MLTALHTVMKRIEDEDRLWKSKERREARKKARKARREAAAAAAAAGANQSISSDQFAQTTEDFKQAGELESKKQRFPGFY